MIEQWRIDSVIRKLGKMSAAHHKEAKVCIAKENAVGAMSFMMSHLVLERAIEIIKEEITRKQPCKS